ncbi:MAG: hypothetical protein CMJ25_00050 [Phycisphaerae bacterium]|nr:hypothetical protein [Phycisphaerae bacterium]|tara:strand:+ start:1433 stop:2629 length:1197 start_codon:yes stop_codon:yes gene_type:complete
MGNPLGVGVSGLRNVYDYVVEGKNHMPFLPKSPLELLKLGVDQTVKATQPPKPTPKPTPTETVTSPTRDVQKASGAKGTQTSPGGGMPTLTAEMIAQRLDKSNIGRGAYSSIQLPGTSSNPDTGGTIEAHPFNGQETSITKNTLGAYANNGVNFTALDNTGINPEFFTNPKLSEAIGSTYQQYGGLASGGGAFAQQSPGSQQPSASPIKSGRLADALNDTAGMQSYMSKFGSSEQDQRRAADMAFLNTEGPGSSLRGLRAKEAVLGQYHAGGQTYQLNDAGTELLQGKDGDPLAIDADAASSYRLGTSNAQDYKNSYKDQVKAALPVTPKQAENPFAQTPAPATQEFQMDIPANTLAPGTDRVGQLIDKTIGMDMISPLSDEQIRNSFLNKREPLMRE